MFTMEGKSFPMGELPQVIKENQLKKIAYDIVKYQKFRPSIAVSKMNASYTNGTKLNYFKAGVAYIENKTKSQTTATGLYDYIDEAIRTHIQPLTPTQAEKRVIYNYKKKKEVKTESPVAKVLREIRNAEPKIYAVKVNDKYIAQNTLNDAKAFANGIKFLKPNQDVGIVYLIVKEIADGGEDES